MTKNKQKKSENKTIKKFFIIIAIILTIICYLINKLTVARPILIVIVVLLLVIMNIWGSNHKLIKGMTTFVGGMIIAILVDSLIVWTFKVIPVFSYNIISYDNIRVYNSIGIRVWQCNKESYDNLKVDPFYKKGYMCDVSDTDAIDINSFLNSIVENYEEYNNNYIKIDGKISKKASRNLVEMQSYEESSITINGYVTFADNITLKILFNEPEEILDNYDVYDDIVVVGLIKNMEKEGNNYVIYMSDSKVVSDTSFNEYTLSVTPSSACKEDKKIFESDNMKVFTHCIDDIIIDYGYKKYELSSALSSGKIGIYELYESPDSSEKNEELDTIYYNDVYNIIVCNQENSKDIFIGDSNMSFKDVSCTRKIEE